MELNSDLIMQFGLMQKLSTGNSILDAVLVMMIPFLWSYILPFLQDLVSKWKGRTTRAKVRREVAFTFKQNRFFDYSEDIPPNHKLQTAILVHLNTLPGFQDSLLTADVKLVKAKKRDSGSSSNSSSSDADDTSSSESDYFWYPGMELEEYEIKVAPPVDEVVTVEPGLTFCRTQKTLSSGNSPGAAKSGETEVTFILEGSSASQIDAFIAAAYDSYRDSIKGEKCSSGEEQRFLYLPVLSGAEGQKEGDFTFRAYPLTDDKDFTNFFHPEKEEILHLVDAFTNKTGKFAIKGYPNKLGFLLHGPPGTGKTSCLKALASHTKRSVINIPLSRIRTNQQLMSLMMDQQVRVEGADYTRPLPHSKVIYVIEDVDAASHVVQRRGGQPEDPLAVALSSLNRHAHAQPADAASTHYAAAPADACGLPAPCERTSAAAKPEVAADAAAPKTALAAGRGRMFLDSGSDALNLAGLLNVLDGVVDTPGRLLVLSSNHPEVLDPALIRPGRINRKVYMGYMATREALQLVSHYFPEITPQQQDALAAVWRDDCVSPAALEALAAECEDVDSLLQGVAVLVRHSGLVSAQHGSSDGTECGAAECRADAVGHGPDTHGGSSGGGNSASSSCDAAAEGLGCSEKEPQADTSCSIGGDCSSESDCRVFIDAGSNEEACSNAVTLQATSCFAEPGS